MAIFSNNAMAKTELRFTSDKPRHENLRRNGQTDTKNAATINRREQELPKSLSPWCDRVRGSWAATRRRDSRNRSDLPSYEVSQQTVVNHRESVMDEPGSYASRSWYRNACTGIRFQDVGQVSNTMQDEIDVAIHVNAQYQSTRTTPSDPDDATRRPILDGILPTEIHKQATGKD
jgi:hypothetical protein